MADNNIQLDTMIEMMRAEAGEKNPVWDAFRRRLGNEARGTGPGDEVAQVDTAPQARQGRLVGHALDLREVGLLQLELRVRDPRLQLAVVS